MVEEQNAAVMELVDMGVSKSPAGNGVRVQVPPAAPPVAEQDEILAYVVGVALGDGNLSNPNGRAVRLRITCDAKYPALGEEIKYSLELLFPQNRVSVALRERTYFDISVYSNRLQELMPWKEGCGTKQEQSATIPLWIYSDLNFIRECIRGLIQTDGCIYKDRGYTMINFSNTTFELAHDVYRAIGMLGYKPTIHEIHPRNSNRKYIVRLVREAQRLIDELNLTKQ